jgi:microcystin-dependent protein
MASIRDYGTIAGETLADPALGGGSGWAAAVAAVLNNSDVSVDERITALQASLGPAIAAAVPTGTIVAFAGTNVPAGWHLCNGQAHNNGALAAVIGSPNTPDLRDRFIVGAGQTYAKGALGGAATVTLTEAQSGLRAHAHTGSSVGESQEHVHGGSTGGASADHAHYVSVGGGGHGHNSAYGNNWQGSTQDQNPAGTDYGPIGWNAPNVGGTFSAGGHGHEGWSGGRNADHGHSFTTGGRSAQHTHGISVNAVAGANAISPHENLPPFYALTYIVKG